MERIPEDKYKINSDIAVFGNKIRMVTQEGGSAGLIINNKQIANTLRILFDLAWDNNSKKKKKKGD